MLLKLLKTSSKFPSVPLLTTEMLRVRRLANSVTSQVMLPPLHMASVEEMPSVSVASFTFCRPLAQAEEHTSQRKTRLAVIRKSWKPVWAQQRLRTLRVRRPGSATDTHENGSEVRVLVDVHVA